MSSNLPGPSQSAQPPSPSDWGGLAPYAGFDADGDGEGRGNSFGRYLAALNRNKWLILLVTVVGTIIGAVVSRYVEPVYTAQATMWVEVSDRGSERSGPIRTGELLQSTAWIELVRSWSVLDHVVREERLYIDTESEADARAFAAFALQERFRPGEYRLTVDGQGRQFALETSQGIVVERGAVGDPIGREIGFDWQPSARVLSAGRVIDFEIRNPRDAAVQLNQQLRTSMPPEGNFLHLSLAGPDPEQLASTINAITDRYVAVATELKSAELVELTGILEEQRRYAEDNLREAEMALEGFRVNTITLPSDEATALSPGLEITRDPVFDSYFEMRVESEQLRQDRQAIERVLGQLESGAVTVEALSLIPSARESAALTQALAERTEKRAQLRALLQQYTEEYKPVQDLQGEVEALEEVTIPRLASGLLAELEGRQGQVESRIASASQDLRQIPTRSIEEARLERQVAIANNLHTTLKQRFEEARLAAASSVPDIRVLDEAVVPYTPTNDTRSMVLLLGFVGSLGASVLGAILFDRLDPRVRYPEQVTHEIGLPILGAIPFVRKDVEKDDHHFAHAAEALRELRLSLLHAHGSAGPLMLTVSSPESGDGKSFVASNLALSFAEQGHKTLLIDGDIRKGALHRLFGALRAPGLTEYLSKQITLEQALQETQMPNVYLIPTGKRMANGPELLSSAAMTELITRVRSHFSVIIIDSPPLGAGVDPYALSTVTRDMLLVLRTGTTNRSFAEAKLELMSRLPVRILGAVLNGTPESSTYRYYSYLPGYQVEDEEVAMQAHDE